jgi:ABC-2 type transport system permease protein
VASAREYLGVYRALAGAYVRSRLEYRASFLARAAGVALTDLSFLALTALAVYRFSEIDGWRFTQLALLYGLSQLAGALARCFSWQLDHFDEYIASGEFDLFLTRPLPPLFHLLAVRFDVMQIGRVLVGAVTVALATSAAGVPATPGSVALILAAVLGGALILFSLTLAVATLSFWYTRTGKLQDVVQNASRAFAEYPLSIYPRGVRALLTWVLPVGLATYYPSLWLLGRAEGALESALAFAALPAGGLFLAAALGFWRLGLKRYQSTGS